ncbi:MAG: PP2C family serine/threonine-protein phosphatase [Verrucomicrobiota bacterium]
MLSLRAAALSDIGKVRRENEDRFLADQKTMIFGVADGVGGLPGGGEAAQQAIDEFSHAFENGAERPRDLVALIHQVNRSVSSLGMKMSPTMGIGTTLTVSCIIQNKLLIAHVGDSRAYFSHGSEFARLTEDHSVENEARLRRARGEVVYYHEANRAALTRCIGQPTAPEVDIIARTLQAGERYLFCTDGVTRMITDMEIGSLLGKVDNPKTAVEEFVNLAVRRGGPDNATAVAIFVDSV